VNSTSTLAELVQALAAYDSPGDVFNPWSDYDSTYDVGPQAPALRRDNLRRFLEPRIGRARHILVAEAVGYQGGKFSGVAMTSERILLGNHPAINTSELLPQGMHRTSQPHPDLPGPVQERGFTEPTATIVYGLLQELPIDFTHVVLWNIFPFHPFVPEEGPLSNRTLTRAEAQEGARYLGLLRNLCQEASIICLGRRSAEALNNSYPCVRHPAQGGANQFRAGLPPLLV